MFFDGRISRRSPDLFVNRDIPEGVVAAGNPCRVIREITEEDKNRYPTGADIDDRR